MQNVATPRDVGDDRGDSFLAHPFERTAPESVRYEPVGMAKLDRWPLRRGQPRDEVTNLIEPVRADLGRQLKERGSQSVTQTFDGVREGRQSLVSSRSWPNVRSVARDLRTEPKPLRDRIAPRFEAASRWDRVKRRVHLHRRKTSRIVIQKLAGVSTRRIHLTDPPPHRPDRSPDTQRGLRRGGTPQDSLGARILAHRVEPNPVGRRNATEMHDSVQSRSAMTPAVRWASAMSVSMGLTDGLRGRIPVSAR